jgi:hypothetical protein
MAAKALCKNVSDWSGFRFFDNILLCRPMKINLTFSESEENKVMGLKIRSMKPKEFLKLLD